MPRIEKKVKILFVLPNFDTGGSEKLVFDIIKNIDKSKFSPVLCVFFTGKYEKEFLKLNIPFYKIHSRSIKSKFYTISLLNKIIRDHKIDIVNTHHSSPLIQGFIPFKIFNNIFWIHTEHTRLDLDPNITLKIIFIQKILLKFVDVSLGISDGVCSYFKNELKVNPKKVIKILNGVDIKRFSLKNFNKKEFKKKLDITENDILIGMFANFRKQKNHENLLKAVRLLINQGIDKFKVILCGDGPRFNEMKHLSQALNINEYITFLGARINIPEIMNILDIYCLPSHFEGLPFSLMEAMAAGKAVIATEVIGNDEIIQANKNGIFVRPNDSTDLATALKTLIQDSDLRNSLSAQAQKDALDFSFDLMLNKYEDLFVNRFNRK
jgi:glycosyltransferase involved in cell wall biosynthesis